MTEAVKASDAAATEPKTDAGAKVDAAASVEDQSAGAKATDAAATDATKDSQAKPVVPEKYELKLPEGSPLAASHVEKIASFAKERGLSNEHAQMLLERENGAVSSFVASQHEEVKAKIEGWKTEASQDKEIGGEAHKQNVELAHRVLKRFGNDAFLDQLDQTGLGNHPELVRIFTRIGKAMTEDKFVHPGSQAGATKKPTSDVFYGGAEKQA